MGSGEQTSINFRFGLRKLFVVVAVFAVLCWVAYFARQVLDTPFEAYATWDGANLIIAHLEEHEGRWPSGWHELERIWQKRNGRTRGGQSIEELGRRLAIDFKIDVASFASAPATVSDGLPRPIRLRSGRETHWAGAEPNELVHRYLKDPQRYLRSGDYWPN